MVLFKTLIIAAVLSCTAAMAQAQVVGLATN